MSRKLDVVTLTGEEYDDLMECKGVVTSLLARAQTPRTDADITALLPIWQQGAWTLPDYGRWVARAVERAHGIKTTPNLCRLCGHSIDAHDKQYGCSEDGCDCETPNNG